MTRLDVERFADKLDKVFIEFLKKHSKKVPCEDTSDPMASTGKGTSGLTASGGEGTSGPTASGSEGISGQTASGGEGTTSGSSPDPDCEVEHVDSVYPKTNASGDNSVSKDPE